MTRNRRLIALATGGTGGHVYPALTLARALSPTHDIILYTDPRGVRFITDSGFKYHVIQSAKMHPGLLGRLRTLVQLGLGYVQSHLFMLVRRPDAIVGFGGYPSFPAVVAAAHRGVPVVLHEQNAIFGRAQRMLVRFAKIVCLSFANTQKADAIPATKLRVTGLPMRPDIVALSGQDYQLPHDNDKFNILIAGGSLASALFGRVIPHGIAKLPADLQAKIHVVQQARPEQIDEISRLYQQHHISAEVLPYIHDMPAALRKAHLFIGRSGASTVTELAIAGRPALYIPLAVSLDGDQAANAAHIIQGGGGWILPEKDFSPESLAAMLGDILNQPSRLTAAASALKGLGRASATQDLAQAVMDVLP